MIKQENKVKVRIITFKQSTTNVEAKLRLRTSIVGVRRPADAKQSRLWDASYFASASTIEVDLTQLESPLPQSKLGPL